eukprot:m.37581 g.37581  ORF g.37581 m.37581 type:complete len:1420 (+) comp5452_c0_seq2:42-4301(+)
MDADAFRRAGEPSLESILNEPDDFDPAALAAPSAPPTRVEASAKSVRERYAARSQVKERVDASPAPTASPAPPLEREREREKSAPSEEKSGVKVLRGVLLTRLSDYMRKDVTRAEVGVPTAMAVQAMMAIGTSRGVTLIFDAKQQWRTTLVSPHHTQYGAVTALAISPDSTRVLVGHERGQILRWDVITGKICNVLTDVYPTNSAVLRVGFFDWRRYAISNDAAGTVVLHTFKRVVGLRTSDKAVLLSGRGKEVCAMTVLNYGTRTAPREIGAVALATRDRLTVIMTLPEPVVILNIARTEDDGDRLPSLSWNFVPINLSRTRVSVEPILAFSWGSTVRFMHMHVPTEPAGRISFAPLGVITLKAPTVVVRWLNDSTILALDTLERARVIDVTSQAIVEIADLSSLKLLSSTRFHQYSAARDADGGPPLRDFACSVSDIEGIVYILGLDGISAVSLFTWTDRIAFLKNDNKFVEALALCKDFYAGKAVATIGLPQDAARRQLAVRELMLDLLQAYADISVSMRGAHPEDDDEKVYGNIAKLCIEYCLDLDSRELLFGDIYDRFSAVSLAHGAFLDALEPYILDDKLTSLSPIVMKAFIEHYERASKVNRLDEVLVRLDVANMDVHQVVMLCWTHALYDAMIYVYNHGLNDYATPLTELMQLLSNAVRARVKDGKTGSAASRMTLDEQGLGYKLLLYISSSLTGHAFPSSRGRLDERDVPRVQWEMYRFLLAERSERDSETYPNIRTLLHFDIREFLNVIAMAFDDMAAGAPREGPRLPTRQMIVDVLLSVMVVEPQSRGQEAFSPEQVGTLFTFLARQMARHKGSIVVDKRHFEMVLDFLAEGDHPGQHEERQQALLELLMAGGFVQFDPARLVRLAERAGFWQVCEFVHMNNGDYVAVGYCYLRDTARRPLVFGFLHDTLSREALPPAEHRKVADFVRRELKTLIGIDAKATAKLLLMDMRGDLRALVALVEDTPELQYQLLGGVFAVKPTLDDSETVEIQPDLHECYLSHMCRLHPQAVHPYLSQTADYRIDECLEIVRAFKITDATALLLERRGDYLQAFSLMHSTLCDRLRRLNIAFVDVEKALSNGQAVTDQRTEAYQSMRDLLSATLTMCLRCTEKMDDGERQRIWFKVLDEFLEAQRGVRLRSPEGYLTMMRDCTKYVINVMMGSVPLPAMLDKILRDPNLKDSFGQLRGLIQEMMSKYEHEKLVYDTTTQILRTDLLRAMRTHRQARHKGYRLASALCGICRRPLCGQSPAATAVFHCGHAFHGHCIESVMDRAQVSCYVCMKSKQQSAKSASTNNQSLWEAMEVENMDATAPATADSITAFKFQQLAKHKESSALPSRSAVLERLAQGQSVPVLTAMTEDELKLRLSSGRPEWSHGDITKGQLPANPMQSGQLDPAYVNMLFGFDGGDYA